MGYVHYVIDTCFTYYLIPLYGHVSTNITYFRQYHDSQTCISSNILSCKCGDSFSNTLFCHNMHLSVCVVISYHTIITMTTLTQHIIFIITTIQFHIHVQLIFLMSHAHVSYYITLSNIACHIFFIHVFTQYRSSHVTCVVHLHVSFYPTYTV